LGAIIVALVVAQSFTVPRKPHWGLDEAAHYLQANKDYAGAGFLIVANASGEGAFISEVVMHDARPDHVVLRSSKVLVNTNWFGTSYQPLYPDAEALRKFLDSAPVSAVVLDGRSPEADADAALQSEYRLRQTVAQALATDPNWRQAEGFPSGDNAAPVQIFTRVGPQPAGDVQLSMRYTLGSNLVLHNDNANPSAGRSASSAYIVWAARTIAIIVAVALRRPGTAVTGSAALSCLLNIAPFCEAQFSYRPET